MTFSGVKNVRNTITCNCKKSEVVMSAFEEVLLNIRDIWVDVCTYMCMYPDAWAFSINYKSADRSTFAMYWGTFVMYPSFWKWH